MIAGSGIKLVETLIYEQLHPDAIEFRSLRLQQVFEVALADTTISVRYKRWMPALEDAGESMLEYFGGGQL